MSAIDIVANLSQAFLPLEPADPIQMQKLRIVVEAAAVTKIIRPSIQFLLFLRKLGLGKSIK